MRTLALLLFLGLSACDTKTDDTNGEADTDTDTDTDADADADTDTDTDADVLTSAHTGWQNPCCFDCHPNDDHRKGLDAYECEACHGSNGAPGGHSGTPPCTKCHTDAHAGCTVSQFPDPLSCQTCHPG